MKKVSISLLLLISLFFIYTQTNQNRKAHLYHTLLGDIGGTNIRFQLVSFIQEQSLLNNNNNKYSIIKDQRYKVKNYQRLQDSIRQFLLNIQQQTYPKVSVISLAGPVKNNTIKLSNVPKWGQIKGYELAEIFNIQKFILINDFQSISYGLEIIQKNQLISLTQKLQLDNKKIQGVIGPGTGLGHSILFRENTYNQLIVIPSQTGQTDFILIDQQSLQYFNFLKQKYQTQYINLQKSFCGPSIPFMYQYYWNKLFPQSLAQFDPKTSQQIIQLCLIPNPQQIYIKVFNLFMKYYSSAIGNFALHHLPIGGIYLVGSLTNSIIQKIKQKDILKQWKQRHPEMKTIIDQIPIVFCNQIDLGLKGAYYLSKKQITRSQNIQNKQKQIKIKIKSIQRQL